MESWPLFEHRAAPRPVALRLGSHRSETNSLGLRQGQ